MAAKNRKMQKTNKGSSQGFTSSKDESDKFDMKKKADARSKEKGKNNNTNTTSSTTQNAKGRAVNQALKKKQGRKKRH